MTTTSFGAPGFSGSGGLAGAGAAANKPRMNATNPSIRRPSDIKLVQLSPQPLVHNLRVGLTLHRLHRLTDEEAEQLLLATLVLGDLVGVRGEDFVDLGIDRAGV